MESTSKLVPKKENGKRSLIHGRKYKKVWSQERVRSDIRQLVQPIRNDPDTTIATNTHTPGRGKVTITKEIDPSNLNMDIGSAKFTFTLKGTDAYGKKHTYKEEIEFSKDEVAKR